MRRVLILILIFLVFTRIYNLKTSARFIWDESSDLVRMHELYLHPRLTLIGPISEDGVKIFGSLTYYMSLPFVILSDFSAVSPAYATAFFGIATVILAFLYLKKQRLPLLAGTLLLVMSYPLMEASRWAWNPHFIPFWQVLSIIFLGWGGWKGLLMSGLFMGLTVHHHYYGILAALGMLLVVLISTKRIKSGLVFLGGLIFGLLPFVVFDLTHPPGLFLTRMIYFSPVTTTGGGFHLNSILRNLITIPWQFSVFIAGENELLGAIILFLSLLNVFLTLKNIKWLIPALTQLLGLSMIGGGIFSHYLLPGIVFYYLWLLTNYKKNIISKMLIWLLIIGNSFSAIGLINRNNWSTNIKATEEVVQKISKEYQEDGEVFNIAVLGSPDPNTKGRRYRDLLSFRNIPIAEVGKFDNLHKVFYLSYLEWEKLRYDPSYELDDFRNMEPIKTWNIENSKWKLYLLTK